MQETSFVISAKPTQAKTAVNWICQLKPVSPSLNFSYIDQDVLLTSNPHVPGRAISAYGQQPDGGARTDQAHVQGPHVRPQVPDYGPGEGPGAQETLGPWGLPG